jgi:ABC transporter with metal-binding/Fe-S-binding domain ATP-binding protein
MRLASLFSGGKDSTYATYLASKKHEIKFLVTMLPERSDSWMFHHPCTELTALQAESMGIEHIKQTTPGKKELELEELKSVLKKIKDDIDGIVAGAVESNYQKTRVERICKELGLELVAPLWGIDQEELLRKQLKTGFDMIITAVAAEGLDKNFIGRKIDEKTIDELCELGKKFGINVAAEGGEYESFVRDCPMFSKKIEIMDSEVVWEGTSGYLVVKKAKLIDK